MQRGNSLSGIGIDWTSLLQEGHLVNLDLLPISDAQLDRVSIFSIALQPLRQTWYLSGSVSCMSGRYTWHNARYRERKPYRLL
jgi:hypothetical protein